MGSNWAQGLAGLPVPPYLSNSTPCLLLAPPGLGWEGRRWRKTRYRKGWDCSDKAGQQRAAKGHEPPWMSPPARGLVPPPGPRTLTYGCRGSQASPFPLPPPPAPPTVQLLAWRPPPFKPVACCLPPARNSQHPPSTVPHVPLPSTVFFLPPPLPHNTHKSPSWTLSWLIPEPSTGSPVLIPRPPRLG